MTENKNVEQEAVIELADKADALRFAEQERAANERVYETLTIGEIHRRKEYLKRMNPGLDTFTKHDIVHYDKYVGDETIRREGVVERNKKMGMIREQSVPAVLLVAFICLMYYFFFFLNNSL